MLSLQRARVRSLFQETKISHASRHGQNQPPKKSHPLTHIFFFNLNLNPFDWISCPCHQTSLDQSPALAELSAGQTSWYFPVQHHRPLPEQIIYVYSVHRNPCYFWKNNSKANVSQMAGANIISAYYAHQEALVPCCVEGQEGILLTSTFEEQVNHLLCWDQASRIDLRIQSVSNTLFAKFYS